MTVYAYEIQIHDIHELSPRYSSHPFPIMGPFEGKLPLHQCFGLSLNVTVILIHWTSMVSCSKGYIEYISNKAHA